MLENKEKLDNTKFVYIVYTAMFENILGVFSNLKKANNRIKKVELKYRHEYEVYKCEIDFIGDEYYVFDNIIKKGN